jgi:hypothetical protein
MAQPTTAEEKKVVPQAVKRPEVPAGFISFDEFISQNPGFSSKYESNKEAHMAIWLDEPVSAFVHTSRLIDPDAKSGVGVVKLLEIPNYATYTLSVTDFINWFGEPNLKLHLASPPPLKEIGRDDKFWRNLRSQKLRMWCRDISMKTAQGERSITTVDNVTATRNNEYGLWDKFPKVYVLPPTQMIMATSASKDIVDFVWESMVSKDVVTTKKKFDEDDIKLVQLDLLAKAKEYKIEGVFGKDATGTVVESFMLAAKEKYVK